MKMVLLSCARLLWLNFSFFIEFPQRRGQIQIFDPRGYCRHLGGLRYGSEAGNQLVLNTNSGHLWKMTVTVKQSNTPSLNRSGIPVKTPLAKSLVAATHVMSLTRR